MKQMKSIALMAMGSAATLAYQKYKAPVTKAVTKAFNKTKKKADGALEDMM